MTNRIILSVEEFSNLEDIAAYVRADSPQNAADLCGKILDPIDSLKFMPNRFKQGGRSQKRGALIRSVAVSAYIVYYRVDDSSAAVIILNVWHGARRPPHHVD